MIKFILNLAFRYQLPYNNSKSTLDRQISLVLPIDEQWIWSPAELITHKLISFRRIHRVQSSRARINKETYVHNINFKK
jgi:hypothetical protein